MNFKLGRKAVKKDSRTLKISKYLTPSLPAAPSSVDYTKGITDFGVMLNNTLGNCTIAGCGHAVQIWTANAYHMITVPDAAILSAYEQWDGYNPSDPSTDQGGIENDVLLSWKNNGLNGHHILGYADPDVKNIAEIKQSIFLAGGAYIGMEVPAYIMQNIPAIWDLPTANQDATIEGGHCVFVCGYDENTFTFISWGKVYKMTIAYWNKFVDEAHAVLGCGWINANKTPSGFDLDQMTADLALIK
jgi:hypothetical protein